MITNDINIVYCFLGTGFVYHCEIPLKLFQFCLIGYKKKKTYLPEHVNFDNLILLLKLNLT